MEEERHKEETKDEQTWLMITDGENDSERHLFYSVTQDRCYVKFVPDLRNKYVVGCYGGLLVLRDKSKEDDCSILNMLTMEILQLPPLNIPPNDIPELLTDCVISSPKMDASCRLIFFNSESQKFSSCQLGDSEFIERDLTRINGNTVIQLINFKGKLYALTNDYWNLIAFDFADPDLRHHEQVVKGNSVLLSMFIGYETQVYLVESCEDLLLIFMDDYDISDVKIFKADFRIGEWVILETLGDRAIFLGYKNTLSSHAASVGMKGNAIYWVKVPSSLFPLDKHLYMYDIDDRSISMSLLLPIVGTYSSLYWVSFCNERKDTNSLFEAFPIETSFHLKRIKATIGLQIEQRKPQKRIKKESLWADLQNDLLLEIFPHLFAGDSVAFRSVCRSWYSISPLTTKTSQQFLRPLKSSDCTSPFLMCPDNKAFHPIHGELYSMDLFPDLVMHAQKVRAAWDGWLLMDYYTRVLGFYNPLTEAEIILPDCDALFYYSVYFSEPPTSADCLVVVAAMRMDYTCAICFKKSQDERWTCREVDESESFFSNCNAVAYQDLYYFLGHGAKLLIFNPKKDEVRLIDAPKFISELKGQQYLLESEGKLIAVFVSADGSSVYTCEWNLCTSKWEILESLGNVMLFVSRPLSISKRATLSGTGNKIYFPRVVGDGGQILFYSLATKRYHTFEMGSSYSNFFDSKFYPDYNGWFMP